MADMVETMAYNQVKPPWHGLGNSVYGKKLSPEGMCKESSTDWEVKYFPSYIVIKGTVYELTRGALVRTKDDKVLCDDIPYDWKIVQNIDAARFFCDYVETGEMEMDTAGSLCGGELVWFLAKITDLGFDLFKGRDHIDPYLLFVNPHRYGMSSSVSLTPIQVVCMNTLRMSLGKSRGTDKIVKVTHRKDFIAEEVKTTLNISKAKMKEFRGMAEYLISHKATDDKIRDYLRTLFPISAEDKTKFSHSAKKIVGLIKTQPGADLAPGSWWQVYCAVTNFADHVASKSPDTRLTSAWFGDMRTKKNDALEMALELAGVSPQI